MRGRGFEGEVGREEGQGQESDLRWRGALGGFNWTQPLPIQLRREPLQYLHRMVFIESNQSTKVGSHLVFLRLLFDNFPWR